MRRVVERCRAPFRPLLPLAGKFGPGDRIEVGLRDGSLSFEQVIER